MKVGDFVRFKKPMLSNNDTLPIWSHGILIEYHTWEKIATILYDGAKIRIASRDVQLAYRANETI
jgi:hypothetical protein